jgi:hypothetical protein
LKHDEGDVDERLEYFSKRIRREVPNAGELHQRLQKVLNEFKDCQDAKGKKLFAEKDLKEYNNILEHARKGCYSDPPDLPMYEPLYVDADGLQVYRCLRGTSVLESIHQKLIAAFSSFDASPSWQVLYCLASGIA